jgi:hypothetical protein
MDHNLSLPIEILHPDPFLVPIIHMSPFSGKLNVEGLSSNCSEKKILDFVSHQLFGKKLHGILTANGREAISLALDAIVDGPDFLISILTPSGSGYVSSCVTKEISKKCRLVYGEVANVDAYFIIHEFGRPMQPSLQVLNSGKPIIEDCAYAFVSTCFGGGYGAIGDYIVYSLPKAFEAQYGGMLYSKRNVLNGLHRSSEPNSYILSRLLNFSEKLRQFNEQRLNVYRHMQIIAQKFNFEEVLVHDGQGVPHAFMVQLNKNIDVEHLKLYMNRQGIESSVFYGGEAYFLPCHQNLTDPEIEYMFYHLRYFFDRGQINS